MIFKNCENCGWVLWIKKLENITWNCSSIKMQKIDDIGKYFGPIVEWRLVNRRTLLNKQGDKMTATRGVESQGALHIVIK